MKPIMSAVIAVALCAAAAGCQYDESSLCGEHQELDEDTGGCRCVEGAILADRLCHMCPAGEVVVDNACVCPEGEVRDETGACVVPPAGLGDPCDGAEQTCDDPAYARCQIDDADAGTGYCTAEGCAEHADCDGGYACAAWASPSYCQRPPTGIGEACGGHDDCASYEADVCFPITGECVTQKCDVALDDCPVGYSCCDLSAFDPNITTVCVPDSFTCPS